MSRMSRRRWRTLLYVSPLEEVEEGLLEPLRLLNGHQPTWALTQSSPAAARGSESLERYAGTTGSE